MGLPEGGPSPQWKLGSVASGELAWGMHEETRGRGVHAPPSPSWPHGVALWASGDVGWGSLWYPDVIRLSKDRRVPREKGLRLGREGSRNPRARIWAGRRVEVRRSLLPSQGLRRRGRREGRARVCRDGEAHPPPTPIHSLPFS